MKRFMTFAGSTYYASGGANDFLDSFDVRKDAVQAGKNACDPECRKENTGWTEDWWHVFDTEKGEVIEGEGHAQC